jgi:hypothetical protein
VNDIPEVDSSAAIPQSYFEQLLSNLKRLAGPPSPTAIAFGRVIERILRGNPELEGAARELGARGWTLPMWSTTEFIADLVAVPAEETDHFITQHYLADDGMLEKSLLGSVLSEDALSHWQPLLKECVAAYEAGLYRVVVPALLLVLEGVLALAGQHMTPKPDAKGVAAKRRKEADRPRVDWLGWLTIEAFVAGIFKSHPYTGERPPLINRNWILHGRDVPQWDRTDCLRLFQAIDTIAAFLTPATKGDAD